MRAREGYWAPRAEDVEAARKRAAAAVLPPTVAAAFSTLLAPNAPRLVELWSGVGPQVNGRAELTLAWAPRNERGDTTAPASVLATIQAGTEARSTNHRARRDHDGSAGRRRAAGNHGRRRHR